MTRLELYDRHDCPYSRLVRNTLDKLDLEYDETVVADEQADRTEVKERTGQTSIPVLLDDRHDDGYIADSTEIVQYLQKTYE